MSHNVTKYRFSPRQIDAIEALLCRSVGESMEDVAARARVSRRTLYRFMDIPEFQEEFKRRCMQELESARAKMAKALIQGGESFGPGQASMQKTFWLLLGELKNKSTVEMTGPGGGPIQTEDRSGSWFEYCTLEEKRIVKEIAVRAEARRREEVGEMSEEVVEGISDKIEEESDV